MSGRAEQGSFLAQLSYWHQRELRMDLSGSGRHVGGLLLQADSFLSQIWNEIQFMNHFSTA